MANFNKTNRSNEESTLFVCDLPDELNEDGIKKLFKDHGKITAIVAPSDAKYAFISYGTFAEAEAAIRALDNKAPLYLQVSFRRKKQDAPTNGHLNSISGDRPAFDYRHTAPAPTPMMQHFNGGHPRPELFQMHIQPTINSPQFRSFGPQFSHQALLPIPTPTPTPPPQVSNGFIQYTPLELQYAERNDLWSRGSLTIDTAGRRHVTMGRGYTRYHIPDPHPNLEEQVSKISEIRRHGSYQFQQDRQHEKIGRCLACNKYSIQTCSICNKHYCNRECQATDWPRHRITDCTLPALNSLPGGIDSLFTPLTPLTPDENNNEHARLTKSRPIQQPQPMRKPKQTAINDQHFIGGIIKKTESLNIDAKKITKSVEEISIDDFNNEDKIIIDDLKKKSLEIIQETTTTTVPSAAAAADDDDNDTNKKAIVIERLEKISEVETPTPTPPPPSAVQHNKINIIDEPDFEFPVSTINDLIPKTEFIECVISHVASPGHLFAVQRFCDVEEINNLMIELNKNASKLKQIKNPECDKIYGVKFANIWHRGQVITVDPLTVEYIDYGATEPITDGQLLDLGEYADLPRFSVHIRLPRESIDEHKLLEVDSIIIIKMVASDPEDDIVDVIVKPDDVVAPIEALTVDIPKDTSPTSVINLVSVDLKIVAVISEKIDDKSAIGILVFDAVNESYDKLIEPLRIECDKAAKTLNNYKAAVNDFVCFQKQDDPTYWLRGIILSTQDDNKIKVASIDEGLVVVPAKIIPTPNLFKDIPMYAVKLSVENKFSFICEEAIGIKITSINSTVVKGLLLEKNESIEITKWTPWQSTLLMSIDSTTTTTTTIIPTINIKNKSQVIIQCHRGPSVVYLKSLETDEVERSNRLTQDVAKASQTALKLTKPPVDGDYLLAQFIDENFYRAQVLAVDGDKIKIVYVDYGNIEITDISQLRIMPKSLINCPQCIAKATLKGIKTSEPTKEASDYLANLAGTEEVLKCTYDTSLMDGVELKTSTNESINDKVNELMTPTWEKKIDTSKTTDAVTTPSLFLSEIEMTKLGEIGETKECILIHIIESGSKYVFAPHDPVLLSQMVTMPESIKQYCDKNTEHYVPRLGELCLSLYEDGNWYRGCCVNTSAEPDAALILFLDYGNMAHVKYVDIRKMVTDFLQPPAIGIICNVDFSVDGKISPQVIAKLDEFLVPNEMFKIKILNIDEDSEYSIEIPDAKNILVQAGLFE